MEKGIITSVPRIDTKIRTAPVVRFASAIAATLPWVGLSAGSESSAITCVRSFLLV